MNSYGEQQIYRAITGMLLPEPEVISVSVKSTQQEQVITPPEGVPGYNKITVEPNLLTTLEVTPTSSPQVFNISDAPNTAYGWNLVKVAAQSASSSTPLSVWHYIGMQLDLPDGVSIDVTPTQQAWESVLQEFGQHLRSAAQTHECTLINMSTGAAEHRSLTSSELTALGITGEVIVKSGGLLFLRSYGTLDNGSVWVLPDALDVTSVSVVPESNKIYVSGGNAGVYSSIDLYQFNRLSPIDPQEPFWNVHQHALADTDTVIPDLMGGTPSLHYCTFYLDLNQG